MSLSTVALMTAAGVALSACATAVIDEATIFSNPATYASYNCKQLRDAQASTSRRVEELQGLMVKAETGAVGSFISEIAYRSDYLAAQGELKSVNAAWERNRCTIEFQSADPAFGRTPAGLEPAAGRSRSRIY